MLLTLISRPQLWLTNLKGKINDRATFGHLLIVARMAHGIELIIVLVIDDNI